jgi:hypothetical protein
VSILVSVLVPLAQFISANAGEAISEFFRTLYHGREAVPAVGGTVVLLVAAAVGLSKLNDRE